MAFGPQLVKTPHKARVLPRRAHPPQVACPLGKERRPIAAPPNRMEYSAATGDPGDSRGGESQQGESSALAPSGQKLNKGGRYDVTLGGPGGLRSRDAAAPPALSDSLWETRAQRQGCCGCGELPPGGSIHAQPASSGAGTGSSAPRATSRGQCFAAGEQASARWTPNLIPLSGSGPSLPICLHLFPGHSLGSCLSRPHTFPDSLRLSLLSQDTCTAP